jgi:superoxide dismutase, Fe-Mn family
MPHSLTKIPYSFDALEPLMDAQTVEIHHTKHHLAYVNNLNTALEKYPEFQSKTLKELLENLNEIPEEIRTAVRNNAGGTINHDLFWEILTPGGAKTPSEKLQEIITKDFASFENMKNQLIESANKHFASGWAFLYQDKEGKLQIKSFPGHDTPLIYGENPLITIDVWEHAYYLKHQNLRADFTKTVFEMINWNIVEQKLI